MSNIFVKFLFGYTAKKLDGKKMYILGIAAILKGILGIIAIYWPESGLPVVSLDQCLAEIWGGVGAFAAKSAIVKSTSCAQVNDGCDQTK